VRSAAALAALLTAILLLVATSQFGSAAPSPQLSPGDQLEYSVTVELQQHHVRGSGKNADLVTESSAQGTAVFAIYSLTQDGTALANVALNLTGNNGGQPVAMQTAVPGKVLSDGQLRMKTQIGLGVSDAFTAANTIVGEIGQHSPISAGQTWSVSSKNPFIDMTMNRKVLAGVKYRGLPAFTLQSVGNGSLLKTADGKPTSGEISVGGTSYYDQQDRLFIGEAFRTLTVISQNGSNVRHDDYSSTYNIVLDTWVHASPAPAQSVEPAQQEPSPEQSTQSASPATPLSSTPYPVPQPSA
jgi:hypothetical protein